jgi:hypothetical protein
MSLLPGFPATTFSSPSIIALKPCSATFAGSSWSLESLPARVSSICARRKKLVCVTPGMSAVTVTPVCGR